MNTTSDRLHFRRLAPSDDLVELADLIHAAYARHATSGLRYWATHQTVADTEKRASRGICFVGELESQLAATITISPPDPASKVLRLRTPGNWSFGQFAVAPQHKGLGLGRQMHDFAVRQAVVRGCRAMMLHTAQPAVALIALYRSWGYVDVGICDWRPHTNYLSVLMAKSLEGMGDVTLPPDSSLPSRG